MIMCMYKKIAISNWELYGKKGEYVAYLSSVLEKVDMLILREKNLGEEVYEQLASSLLSKSGERKE